MKKGGIFLLLAFALIVVTIILIYYYERPVKADSITAAELTECGSDTTCVATAIARACEPAHFELINPFNETCVLSGLVKARAVGKCEVVLEDTFNGDTMTCYLDAPLPSDFSAYKSLASSCSGPLFDRIKNI